MKRHVLIVCGIACGLAFACFAAAAQPVSSTNQKNQTALSFSALSLYQFDSDLDGGGQVEIDRYFLRLNASRQLTPSVKAGLGLSYDYEHWDFSGANLFGGAPWETIHRQGLDLNLEYTGIENWSFHFMPSVQFARESGADWDDSLAFGAVAMVNYRFNPRLALGVGAGAFRDLEETRFFPFVTIHWQITDHLRLSNPLRSGPAGAAGLELAYTPNRQLEFALGGAWRSFRFRLDDDQNAHAPNGVGQVDIIPLWARISLNLSSRMGLDLYAGGAFDGTLRQEDENGNLINEVDHDAAPFAALLFRINF